MHGWTSAIDDLLSSGETLAWVAVGNGGERDARLRFNRVPVPADSVNALSIGAVDSLGAAWSRAPYRSIGPCRSPGLVKPDLVGFGGSPAEPFWVIDPDNTNRTTSAAGTSVSSPAAQDCSRHPCPLWRSPGPPRHPRASRSRCRIGQPPTRRRRLGTVARDDGGLRRLSRRDGPHRLPGRDRAIPVHPRADSAA